MAAKPILFIPPGGFQGFAQQTIAVQALVSKPTRRRGKKKTRKKRANKKTAKRRPRTAARKSGRLKKGSPEAKRRMAKLRAMQKKKRRTK